MRTSGASLPCCSAGCKHSITVINYLIAQPWPSLHPNCIGLWLVSLVWSSQGSRGERAWRMSPGLQLALGRPVSCLCGSPKHQVEPLSSRKSSWNARKDGSLTFKHEILKIALVLKSWAAAFTKWKGGGNMPMVGDAAEGSPWLQNLGKGLLTPRPLEKDRIG